jgi:hypothetical protein
MVKVRFEKYCKNEVFKWLFKIKKFNLFKGFEITIFGLNISVIEKEFFNKIGTISFCSFVF